jgi:phosphoglycolate phosphatase
VDAYLAIIASFNYTMRQAGYPLQSAALIRKSVGWGDENLLRPFVKPKDLQKVLEIYRRHHRNALLKNSRLFPGVLKMLKRFKRKGYKLAVASNRPTRFSWILIRHLKLKAYFDYVLCADKLKHAKPHPEILKKILQKFSLLPKEALYVGDMTIDAQAGRRAKVATVIVTTGSSPLPEIQKEHPWAIFRSITELVKIPSS